MNIGSIFLYNNQLDLALECRTTFYQFCLQQYGETNTKTASALNALMAIYCVKKDYEKAIEHGLQCLKIKEAFYGFDHLETATTYYNLGRVYFDDSVSKKKENDVPSFNRAIDYYNKAVRIREREFGEVHERTARVYHDIGFVYDEKKDYTKSLEYYKKAMNIKEQLVVSNNGIKPSLANTYNNIGLVYGSVGENRKKLDYHVKALEIQINILGEDHNLTKKSYEHVVDAFENLGDDEKKVIMDSDDSNDKALMTMIQKAEQNVHEAEA